MPPSGIVGEYRALKRQTEADLLAMQMGDFYEFFEEDARTVGGEIDLKVSKRSAGGETYEMAGVPVDDLTPYLTALVERGYRVAVADQRETTDGHKREIDRVVTPGTLLDVTDGDARYLAAIVRDGRGEMSSGGSHGGDGAGEMYGLAFVDITTGRFHVTEVGGTEARMQALTELYRFAPVEVLPGPDLRDDEEFLSRFRERIETEVTSYEPEAFAPGRARHVVDEHFGESAVGSVGLADNVTGIQAAGAALTYIEETGVGALASVTRLQAYGADDHVEVDATTQRNLELAESMTDAGRSLFETIDHTKTSAGGRLLREWLCRPLRAQDELSRRQAAVAALAADAMARDRLRESLAEAADLERLASRAASGTADARDLLHIRRTLGVLPDLVAAVGSSQHLAESPVATLLETLDREAATEMYGDLMEALADDPPESLTGGGLIRRGYDDELDELVDRHEEAVEWIDGLAEREQRHHDISRLTVDRNRTDGYYIQVAKSEREKVPDEYEGIKTLKNAERYIHPELEEREREILRLEERRGDIEYELFQDLRKQVADTADVLQAVGRAIAELDTLGSLAAHAVHNDWTRPELAQEGGLFVEGGRHPVVEQTTEFVPNDLRMDDDRRFLLVTGPNMSGKSTYMRQAALIVLLAQVGSFVPARSARIGLVDGIYTRVGALDELAQGRSTFMVEMQELSNILHSATEDSLVILDEVGRGTATYDGISIAWAATEYLHNEIHALTLFATHYHELTQLAEHLDRVANVHIAAEERDGDVTFLRTVEPGATDRSYGIHVATLAGVPGPVVNRARDVLDRLRADKAIEARGATGSEAVQAVFDLGSGSFRGGATADGGDMDPLDPATESVLEELRDTDVNETSPVDLLKRVEEWQRRLEDG